MKVYNDTTERDLCEELKAELGQIRSMRGFEARKYAREKAQLLNKYMQKCGLSTCVVAVSGGVDSAIVLGLVKLAQTMEDSCIKHIIPVLLPCPNNLGVTNQDLATIRGIEVCRKFNTAPYIVDMEHIVGRIKKRVDQEIGIFGEAWAGGQLVPYSRTPVLYYITSLMSQRGTPAIICGTTNFSEGGYLGYIGKASDGMVDVQMISDIYKSEVYKVAEYLGVPESILNVTPAGDMYDGRMDEDVFGASYDFVELYQTYLKWRKEDQQEFLNGLSTEALKEFKRYADNLEKLHAYNRHKYISKSPAVHLDLYPSGVPDGWDNYIESLSKVF